MQHADLLSFAYNLQQSALLNDTRVKIAFKKLLFILTWLAAKRNLCPSFGSPFLQLHSLLLFYKTKHYLNNFFHNHFITFFLVYFIVTRIWHCEQTKEDCSSKVNRSTNTLTCSNRE